MPWKHGGEHELSKMATKIDHANRVFIHSIYGKYALIIDNSKGGLGTEVEVESLVSPKVGATPVFAKKAEEPEEEADIQ